MDKSECDFWDLYRHIDVCFFCVWIVKFPSTNLLLHEAKGYLEIMGSR